ncbi:MAG: hypothetical protein D6731_06290, partial [Planctomycetota bacterium]
MDAVILLLGRCGLERLAEPLRRLSGVEVHVASWTQTDLVRRLEPTLTYVDLFDWDAVAPLVRDVLCGRPPQIELDLLRAVVAALPDDGVVYRGLRRPEAGAFGLLPSRASRALDEALDRLESVVRGRRVLDVGGLWARRGLVSEQVRHGLGHGEAPAAAEAEAGWLHALWVARTRGPYKCLVVDLDDTLIHGELVDDRFHERNPAYLPLGEEPRRGVLEGFWRLKRGLHEALRVVQGRGILLALATRNDPEVVRRRWR